MTGNFVKLNGLFKTTYFYIDYKDGKWYEIYRLLYPRLFNRMNYTLEFSNNVNKFVISGVKISKGYSKEFEKVLKELDKNLVSMFGTYYINFINSITL